MLFIGNGRGENDQTSNDEFRLIVIVEFVIKMDCPYAVNELILVLELVASEFENEISLPKALGTCLINHTDSFNSSLKLDVVFLVFHWLLIQSYSRSPSTLH